jgi:hypothetical protein
MLGDAARYAHNLGRMHASILVDVDVWSARRNVPASQLVVLSRPPFTGAAK